MEQRSATRLKYILFFIFALSGFSGLIYESIWTHYIKLLLGHAAYAQTLVLSIFMGGMAIGAALTARKNRLLKTPLRTYAIIEAIIGITAILFHSVFVSTEALLHQSIIPSLDSVVMIEIVRWTLASLLILPQSILLGTTFPLIATGVVRLDKQHSGSTLGMLYFTNSFGAAIGVLFSVFVLIASFGLPGTVLTAGVINIFIAIAVYGLSKNEVTADQLQTSTVQTEEKDEETSDDKTLSTNWFFAIALLTGLASFLYEIGWIRMLSMVLSSSMQAFELMLSAFIFGIAFGGYWIRKRIESIKNPAYFLGKVQIIMGILALATLPLYNYMFDFMGFLINSFTKSEGGYLLFNLGSHAIAMLIMLPATFMAGMTLPLITFTLLKWKKGEQSIGRVYAFNTIGAILGILLAVHLLMPVIGTKGLIVVGAFIDVCLGIYLLFRYTNTSEASKQVWVNSFAAVVLFLGISISSQLDPIKMISGIYRTGQMGFDKDAEVLYYKDGKTASISVVNTPNVKTIVTNGKPDAGLTPLNTTYSPDEITMIMAAALPLSLHPDAKEIANIGMGSGLTTHTLLLDQNITSLDTIEIESSVVEGIEYFGERVNLALDDPRSNLTIDDAKSFFSRNKTQYDIIVSEPSNPWVSGVAGLFSIEFYNQINKYLKQDGVLVQWIQLYEIDVRLITSIINALNTSFNNYAIYNTNDHDLMIVASNERDLTKLSPEIFNNEGMRSQLKRVSIEDISDISSRLIGTKQILQPYFDSLFIQPNSDYFPILGLNAPKTRYLRKSANELSMLHVAPFPPALLNKSPVNSPSASPYFSGDKYRRNARETLRLLTGFAMSDKKEKISDPMRSAVIIVKETLDYCESYTERQDLFDKSLYQVSIKTTPFINHKKLGEFWESLKNHECLSVWPEEVNLQIQLYTAIYEKNHIQTIVIAEKLLAKPNFAGTNKSFLLAAVIDSAIRINKFKEGRAFVNLQLQKLGPNFKPDLYLKVLLARINNLANNTP